MNYYKYSNILLSNVQNAHEYGSTTMGQAFERFEKNFTPNRVSDTIDLVCKQQ